MKRDRHSDNTQTSGGCIYMPISCVLTYIVFSVLYHLFPFLFEGFEGGHSVWDFILGIFWIVLFGFTVFALTSIFISKIHFSENVPDIKKRNVEALKTLNAINNGEKFREYFIFLRSFKLEALEYNWYWQPITYTGDSLHSTSIDEELSYILNELNVSLICLGDTKKLKLGAARLTTTDNNWREAVDTLLNHASGIIISPGHTKSIEEEIKKIYKNKVLADKSVFLMLPGGSHPFYWLAWEQTKNNLEKMNIILPDFDKSGLIFNTNGNSVPLTGIHIQTPIDLLKNILDIIPLR